MFYYKCGKHFYYSIINTSCIFASLLRSILLFARQRQFASAALCLFATSYASICLSEKLQKSLPVSYTRVKYLLFRTSFKTLFVQLSLRWLCDRSRLQSRGCESMRLTNYFISACCSRLWLKLTLYTYLAYCIVSSKGAIPLQPT